MKVIAVIPARGGSRRCPRKNIAQLGPYPLIVWTIKSALECNLFDKVIVTTDDEEIANVAKDYDVTVWKRDPILARDSTPMLPVVLDVFGAHPADIVVTLQPTSPFRRIEDIKAAYQLLIESKGDSVFSVTEAEEDLVFELGHSKQLRRCPNVVVPNGALFLITGEALNRGESWFSGYAYGYSMPKEQSLDIDTPLDLEIARMIVRGDIAA